MIFQFLDNISPIFYHPLIISHGITYYMVVVKCQLHNFFISFMFGSLFFSIRKSFTSFGPNFIFLNNAMNS